MKAAGPEITTTPVGFLVAFTSIASLIIGGLLLSPVFVVAGMLGIFFWLACRRATGEELQGLRFRRPLPSHAWAGRSFAVETEILTPHAGRVGAKLLFHDPVSAGKPQALEIRENGSRLALRYPARVGMRGSYQFPHWTVVSTWPLGWFSARLSGRFDPAEGTGPTGNRSLMVLPDPFLPPRLLRHLDGRLASVNHITGQPDPVAEFRLLREFQHGDPIRSIHWPSTLRGGDLLVREPDPPRPLPYRYGILLHSYCPGGELLIPEAFEQMLRILAGLLYRFRKAEIDVELRQTGGKAQRVRSREDFDRALLALATLRRLPIRDRNSLIASTTGLDTCDEVFLLSDVPRRNWETELASVAPSVTMVDATSVSLSRKPTISTGRRRAS